MVFFRSHFIFKLKVFSFLTFFHCKAFFFILLVTAVSFVHALLKIDSVNGHISAVPGLLLSAPASQEKGNWDYSGL